MMPEVVTPAKAGVQEANLVRFWIPASAGMTASSYFSFPDQNDDDFSRCNLVPLMSWWFAFPVQSKGA